MCTMSPQQPDKAIDSRRELAFQLIDSATRGARGLAPSEQASLLSEAAWALSQVDARRAEAYWQAAFDLAGHLDPKESSNQRARIQSSVMTQWAHYDPGRAVDLLQRMDRPDSTAEPDVDWRSMAAFVVVNVLIKRDAPQDLGTARKLLRHLGETGEYPYAAAGQLIDAFERKKDSHGANDVFAEALHAFPQAAMFRGGVEDFTGLIRRSQGKVRDGLLLEAVRQVLAEARRQDERARRSRDAKPTELVMRSGQGELRFSQSSTCLAFRLLPLLERLDAAMARELTQSDPELRALVEKMPSEEISKWSASVPARDERGSEDSRQPLTEAQIVGGLKSLVQSAFPDAAFQSPELEAAEPAELPPFLRGIFLAQLSGGLTKDFPDRARPLVEQAQSLAEGIKEPGRRAFALIELGAAFHELKEEEKSAQFLDEAFSLTLELSKTASAKSPPRRLSDSPEFILDRLASVEVAIDARRAAARSDLIPDLRLKLHYMVLVARSILMPPGREPMGYDINTL